MKLSAKQKQVIRLMREGQILYENKVTPGARWSLSKYKNNYRWGNVNGNVIAKIIHLINESKESLGVRRYELNEQGKTINID